MGDAGVKHAETQGAPAQGRGRDGLFRAVGLMSGTSADGIDAALIETDGEGRVHVIAGQSRPFVPETRASLLAAMRAARAQGAQTTETPEIRDAMRRLTLAAAEAVGDVIAQAGLTAEAVDVVGFHGQTVNHLPDKGFTWQIGDADLLAQLTGIDVAHDFRSADVAAGGQGAPFAPAYHRARALSAGEALPVAVLNVGGVANVTWIGEADMIAFDTGPGNALLDDWVHAHTGLSFDAGGALAGSGVVHEDVLTALLDHPYFDAPPPKSLDRNDFDIAAARGLSAADGAATLAAMTVGAVALAARLLPAPPVRWIVTGGGAHNAHLMAELARALGAPVVDAGAVGWDGDLLEAEAFAYLAVRSMRGLPLSWPGTTGVPEPMPGGRLTRASR